MAGTENGGNQRWIHHPNSSQAMLLMWACSIRISVSEIQHVYHLTPLRGKPSSARNKQQSCWDNDSQVLYKVRALEQAAWMDPPTWDQTLCSSTPAATQCLCVTRVVLVRVVVESSALRVKLGLTEHLTAALMSTGNTVLYTDCGSGEKQMTAHSLCLYILRLFETQSF